MYDIVITSGRIRQELAVLSVCFAFVFLVNAGAVIWYSRSWTEIFSQSGYVIVLTAGLYAAVAVLRFIVYALRTLCTRIFQKQN